MSGCVVAGIYWRGPGLPGPFDKLAALLLGLAGAFFGIAGVWVLGKNRTIFPEPRVGSILVRKGIYRHVRHPLYSSVMLLALAWASWLGSFPALGVGIVLTAFLILKSINEETRLLRRFPDYANYRCTTRRFIPWLF
jgi:protein-S-isoprenylcysteine O-methyltransferase Ste14